MRKSSKAAVRGKASLNDSSPFLQRKLKLALLRFVMQLRKFCASRRLTFPDDLELIFPGGRHYTFSRRKSLTNIQKRILKEYGTRFRLQLCKMIAEDEQERRRIEKAESAYDSVRFPGRRKSAEKRAAYEFLVLWQEGEVFDRAYPHKALCWIAPLRVGALEPLLNALSERDAEFFQGLASAMRSANRFSKHERVRIKKRLLETDELVHPTGPILSWLEILRKHAPDWKDSHENFRALLDECGIRYTLLNRQEPLKKSAKIIGQRV
jgi:hypothetical protein